MLLRRSTTAGGSLGVARNWSAKAFIDSVQYSLEQNPLTLKESCSLPKLMTSLVAPLQP